MSHFDLILLSSLGKMVARLKLLVLAPPPPPPPPAAPISTFFTNLYGQLTVFAGAMTIFFFALAAIFYGASVLASSERTRSHAIASIYGALIGLALTLLAGTAAAIVSSAAGH